MDMGIFKSSTSTKPKRKINSNIFLLMVRASVTRSR